MSVVSSALPAAGLPLFVCLALLLLACTQVVCQVPTAITAVSGCMGQPINSTSSPVVTAGCFTGQAVTITGSGFLSCATTFPAVRFLSTVQPGRVYSVAVDGNNCTAWSGGGSLVTCKVPDVDVLDRNQPLLVAGVDCYGNQSATYPSIAMTFNGEVQPLSALTTNGPFVLTGISGVEKLHARR